MLRSASVSAETICVGVSENVTLSLYIFVPYELSSSSSSLLELPLLQEMSAPPRRIAKTEKNTAVKMFFLINCFLIKKIS